MPRHFGPGAPLLSQLLSLWVHQALGPRQRFSRGVFHQCRLVLEGALQVNENLCSACWNGCVRPDF